MTIEQYGARPDFEDEFLEGLDDIKAEDMGAPPRLNIEHHEKVFEVSGSGEKFDTIDLIILGMVRQRTLWFPDIPDGESPPPMCKSTDFIHGFPEMSEELKSEYRFPWNASGLAPAALEDNGPGIKPSVKCEDCKLKEWGTDPKSSNRPWCGEEFTLPVLYNSDGDWKPALITLKRSSLKNAKSYMASFKASRTPLFAYQTTLSLTQNKRGTVRYCVPNFSKGPATEQDQWTYYLDTFKGVRDYLKAFPQVRDDDAGPGPGDSGGLAGAENTDDPWGSSEPEAQKAQPKKRPAAPKAEPKPEPEVVEADVVDDDDDEPPF